MRLVRVVLYTGKGGVGKTTTAAATALCAAARGRRVLVASADAAHSLGDVLEQRLGPAAVAIAPGADAIELDARSEMSRHWGRIQEWLVALFRSQGVESMIADELALMPGAEELACLLAVEEHARSGGYDLVVVDCAPSDATLRLLTLPDVARVALRVLLRMQQLVAAAVTPLARAVVATPLPDAGVLRDLERLLYRRLRALHRLVAAETTSVRLVLGPERLTIEEARRTHADLCLFDVACDAVVMNRVLPAAAAGEPFFDDWRRMEAERRKEVTALFAPLPVLEGSLGEDEITGVARLRAHGEQLFGERDPGAVLARPPRTRFADDAAGPRVELPLGHGDRAGLDVTKLDDELVVRTATRRRAILLPRRFARLDVASARCERDRLVVRFRSEPR